MTRYLVQRTFPTGLAIPMNSAGAALIATVNAVNADAGVTWLRSYVTDDKRTTFCIYDSPSTDAIRAVAERNGLPVDSITPISVLDAHPYL
jgi:hypothetical protein